MSVSKGGVVDYPGELPRYFSGRFLDPARTVQCGKGWLPLLEAFHRQVVEQVGDCRWIFVKPPRRPERWYMRANAITPRKRAHRALGADQ